jgi:hypothetical protein
MLQTCIKPSCGQKYESEEPDAYYCPSCLELKRSAAAELDAKFDTRGQQPSSGLTEYDRACAGRKFPRAADLGITI